MAKNPQRDIIARCDNCLRPFVAGRAGGGGLALGAGGQSVHVEHMVIGRPGQVQMRGVQVSCPYCGSFGRVPDGFYDFLREGFRVLRTITPSEATRMAATIQRYREGETDEAGVAESTPAAAREFVTAALQKADKKFWVQIILTIVLAVMSNRDLQGIRSGVDNKAAEVTAQIEQLQEHERALAEQVRQLIAQMARERSEAAPLEPPIEKHRMAAAHPREKLRRNDPCWCGSGRKVKRCHGWASV